MSQPLDKLRLIDDQADRWTNPVIEVFSADEITDTPFGSNIINTDLTAALLDLAGRHRRAFAALRQRC